MADEDVEVEDDTKLPELRVEVREVLDPTNARPTGTYRLALVYEDGGVYGLCTHSHATQDEAHLCPDALAEIDGAQ